MTLIFSVCFSFGQTSIDKQFVEKIDIGYSTRWDIEQILGKGEYLQKTILNPDDIQEPGKSGLVHANGLQYKSKGVTFVCADDGELISSIHFSSPFKFSLNQLDTIEIGKSLLGQSFPNIDTFKVNTTGASNYWSFQIARLSFFIEKPKEHRNKSHYSEVPSFKDNIDYYKKQPISIVTIDLHDYESFKQEFDKEKTVQCNKPLYIPKGEQHRNCFDLGWPDKVPTVLRPFYALTGGQKSERIKQGYWKEYSPSHKLIYEGEFKDSKEVGLFKYYDSDGQLERTEKFSESRFNLTYLIIFGLVTSLLIIITILKRKKNAR